ncbi:OLC1v1005416C1 [Oldenlandia corymbosa var. corymbosa]|uniref:OLC1v1005416C1 n=1 Tax=Oldenlandia corymbosa var. corymbosa TaxID=529605 RepID=A0AAV1DGY1_OLDCO|nr:OLC1v1005416C1 [Oldenlandia corymbosa var. corymbosa]
MQKNNEIYTAYARQEPRNLPSCSASGDHSAEFLAKIQGFSSLKRSFKEKPLVGVAMKGIQKLLGSSRALWSPIHWRPHHQVYHGEGITSKLGVLKRLVKKLTKKEDVGADADNNGEEWMDIYKNENPKPGFESFEMAALSTHGTRDLWEVVAEIRDEFVVATEYGKEVVLMLEVGKLPYRYSFLKGLLLRLLKSSSGIESPYNLSSTLEKLYVWEKNFYKAVKAEEKLRIINKKQCEQLTHLDKNGAEPNKIDAMRASIRNSDTKLKFCFKTITVITIRIDKLGDDEELQPQVAGLIHGLITMWKSMLGCHQKHFRAIMESEIRMLKADTGFQKDSNSRASRKLEAELRACDPNCTTSKLFNSLQKPNSLSSLLMFHYQKKLIEFPTNATHIVFGLQGSEKTFHFRKAYVESWWRPNKTRGYVYLDKNPTGDLLPWSTKSPAYRINDDLSKLIAEIRPRSTLMPRMVHGILELFREEHEGMRWLVMGDDDTMFFVDNLVDVLSKYDHKKYYYIGYPSEFVLSNHWFNFNQAFGGGGIILSYPLVKALVNDIDRCLRTYSNLSADLMTMACVADIGVNLTPHKGIHQNDLRGDYSGFLSSHPKELVLSLHHWDVLDPIFPTMNRYQSAQHLMKAGDVDQSRLFQQTICYHRQMNWTFSISWGYSAHIYEKIQARSWIMTPIETFRGWSGNRQQPKFMFNIRRPFGDPCEAPHVFFFESIEKMPNSNDIHTVYARQVPRHLPSCSASGNHSAEFVAKIHVFSSPKRRSQVDRAECCDIVRVEGTGKAEVRFRECKLDEIMA